VAKSAHLTSSGMYNFQIHTNTTWGGSTMTMTPMVRVLRPGRLRSRAADGRHERLDGGGVVRVRHPFDPLRRGASATR
jgi:hypothetical protein